MLYKYIVGHYPEDPVPYIIKEKEKTFKSEDVTSPHISVFDDFESARQFVIAHLKARAEDILDLCEVVKKWKKEDILDLCEEVKGG